MGFHKREEYILCIIHSRKEIRAHQRVFLHQILSIGEISVLYCSVSKSTVIFDHTNEVMHHTIFGLNREDKPGAALAQECIQSAAYKEKQTYIHLQVIRCLGTRVARPASQSFHFPTEPVTQVLNRAAFLEGGKNACAYLTC